MKRRSKSSPPSTKRPFTEPGTPGPFTADLARDQRQRDFPGASPTSTKKTDALRKQLFQNTLMVRIRAGTSATMNSSGSSANTPAPLHRTPPSQEGNDVSIEELPQFPLPAIDVDQLPRGVPNRREREPADVHDLVTQQTEVLAGMLAERRARQGHARSRGSGGPKLRLEQVDITPRDFFSGTRGRPSPADGRFPLRTGPHPGRT